MADIVRLRNALAEVVGYENVLWDPHSLKAYSMDALRPYRAFPQLPPSGYMPDLVVRPGSTDEVAGVVRLAAESKVPIVPYGAGTGLMGGAAPITGGIIVDMKRMNRILNISREDRAVTAQAGIILEDLDLELNKYGLMLGHDPWTRPIATLGGAISTNGLGYLGGKYGSIGDQLLGVEAVLPDGSIVRTRPVSRSSTGPDLTGLFVGTEGCFGIVTEATIRAYPKPEKAALRAVRFKSFEGGFKAIMRMYELGIQPTMLDYGGSSGKGCGYSLILLFDGLKEEVGILEERTLRICEDFGGEDLGDGPARGFWSSRHEIAKRYQRRVQRELEGEGATIPDNVRYEYVHVSLPPSKVLEYKARCEKTMAKYGVEILEVGLWHEPSLFNMVLSCKGGDGKDAAERLARAVDEALILAQDLGGAIEYCHGIGIRLAHLMEREHGRALEVMRVVKRALDPNAIMNPGKLAL